MKVTSALLTASRSAYGSRLAWYALLSALAVVAWHGWIVGAALAQGATQKPTDAGPKAVLELFTSQGCSSCPPADALLQTYAAKSDIVALTFPVDYWDYLGWKDTLAQPKFSARQRYYAKHRGDGRIYTPQVVINGMAHANGAISKEIDAAIAASAGEFAKARVPVQVRIEGGQVIIDVGASANSNSKEADVWLLMIQREADVAIKAGENRGKSLKYFNVVREKTPIGMWSGQPMTIRLNRESIAAPGADACAVLIQSGRVGFLLGAAILNSF